MIVREIMLRQLGAGAAAVLLMVLVEHLLPRNAVRKYYVTHLPHYDSIRSYTFAYEVLNAYANESWWAGVKLVTGFGLSLTQPSFAALLAPFVSPTPQSLLLYNTRCLGLLSGSLYAYISGTRTGRGSALRGLRRLNSRTRLVPRISGSPRGLVPCPRDACNR
jgi:hypothetical protein